MLLGQVQEKQLASEQNVQRQTALKRFLATDAHREDAPSRHARWRRADARHAPRALAIEQQQRSSVVEVAAGRKRQAGEIVKQLESNVNSCATSTRRSSTPSIS